MYYHHGHPRITVCFFVAKGQFQGNAFGLQKLGRDPRPLSPEVVEGLAKGVMEQWGRWEKQIVNYIIWGLYGIIVIMGMNY